MDAEEFSVKINSEDSKTKKFATGTVIYEKSSTGQIIANVIPKKRKIRRPPVIQEMKNCPIDESNVENVLDRMVMVTESLQQLLQSYKDDLKKTGGGFVPRPSELKPNILKKRLEIAERLTSTYATYRQAVDDIAEVEIGGCEILKQFPLSTSNPVYAPPSLAARKTTPKWPKIEVKNKIAKSALAKEMPQAKTSQQQQPASGNRKPFQTNNNLNKPNANNVTKKPVYNNNNNNNNKPLPGKHLGSGKNPGPGIFKKTGSVKNENLEIQGDGKLGNEELLVAEGVNVSNDLFMSCENCVDDDVYTRAEFSNAEFYDSDDDSEDLLSDGGELENLSSDNEDSEME